ncbi:MAG: hypothetical protein AAFR93_01295 [Pseudomonadota bacterium]
MIARLVETVLLALFGAAPRREPVRIRVDQDRQTGRGQGRDL